MNSEEKPSNKCSNRCNEQWDIFLLALGFLTRLPVPSIKNFHEDKLNHASRYFPLVGFVIGSLIASVFYVCHLFLPLSTAVIIAIISGLLITGAFHEDGLADTFDGFGGAFARDKKLQIMKDSRIGTYGTAALWAALSLKAVLLIEVINPVAAIISAHVLSRATAISLMARLPYVQENSSKSKPLAQKLSATDKKIIALTALAALVLIIKQAIVVVIVLWLVRQACLYWFNKQIAGFTGDTLGACQQIAEISIYAAIIIATGAL